MAQDDRSPAEPSRGARRRVIDTHLHLASGWQEGGGGLVNQFLRDSSEGVAEGTGFNRQWDEDAYRRAIDASTVVEVEQAVHVECFNRPIEAETRWVMDMCADPRSLVSAVVAHLPVREGAAAVEAALAPLRGPGGALPPALKGARAVFLGAPMPPADACLEPSFLEGLAVLERNGLHWEFCCQPCALPHVAEVCGRFPGLTFVLDHVGHNAGGEDFDEWSAALAKVAANPNVFCKLGATEEWGVKDTVAFAARAMSLFGIDRIMYESNWFVSEALGDPYDRTFKCNIAALESLGWTSEEQLEKFFRGNARAVYRLA